MLWQLPILSIVGQWLNPKKKTYVLVYIRGYAQELENIHPVNPFPVKGAQRIYEIVIKSALLNKLS
jgi:hypothetical protein